MYIIKQYVYLLSIMYMTYLCFLSPYTHLSLSIYIFGISAFEYIENIYEYI